MPAQPKQITIKTITKDDLDATYPRVIATVVNDKDKEVNLTIFKKKAKEQDDGTTTPEIIPQEGHSYMGYFKKPKEGFHMWSYNIAWEIHSEDTPDEPTENTEEPIAEGETPPEFHNECRNCGKLFWTPDAQKIICNECKETPPPTPPEPETPKPQPKPGDFDLRLRVAEVVAQLCNRYSEKTSMKEFVKMCRELETKYVTGE